MFTLAIPAETLHQRADVRAAEYAVLEAMGLLGQADAATRPGFALGGSLGLSSVSLGTLLQGRSVLSSLFGTVSLPVFDGGASRARVEVREAALEQARLAHRAVILRALGDVENALSALRDDRARRVSLNAVVASAQRAAGLARLRHRSGLVDFQIVLATERTLLLAEDAAARAESAVNLDQINLYKALGGGWVAGTDLPAGAAAEGGIP